MIAATEDSDAFRRTFFSRRRCIWPRRYVMAFLLFLLLLILEWRNLNVFAMITKEFIREDRGESSIGNWTIKDLSNYLLADLVVDIPTQVPGAILIFIFSSHTYLLASTVVTSILQILTPAALQHHSASLLVVTLGRVLIEAPIFTAVISTWKDWAPPLERTKLIIFSMFGIFIGFAAALFDPHITFIGSYESFYFSGIAGLIWALLWYNITSDSPQNDPLISEHELRYLKGSIPPDIQQKTSLKDIPWKSILTSKPIILLCIIFFKMSCSLEIIVYGSFSFANYFISMDIYHPLFIFVPCFLAVLITVPCSTILFSFLINRYRGRTLLIRKCFLCVGFFLQCVFMFGILSSSKLVKVVSFVTSYVIFTASAPGFISLPLDLSPRYVSIVAGFLYTFFYMGKLCAEFVARNINTLDLDSIVWFFILDGVVTLISVALFAKWGEVEEQLWSQSGFRNPVSNNCRSCPKPEHQDD